MKKRCNVNHSWASVSASAMFVSHTSTGGSGAMSVPPATGLEPAALQSPPQYEKGEEEEAAGEWGRVKDNEGERGSEQGKGGVLSPFLGPFWRYCCSHKLKEGETARERGKGWGGVPLARRPQVCCGPRAGGGWRDSERDGGSEWGREQGRLLTDCRKGWRGAVGGTSILGCFPVAMLFRRARWSETGREGRSTCETPIKYVCK